MEKFCICLLILASVVAPALPSRAEGLVLLNINKAQLKDIAMLPGMNIMSARRLVQYREQQGLIRSADDLVKAGIISSDTARAIAKMIKYTDVDPEIPVGRINLESKIEQPVSQDGSARNQTVKTPAVPQDPGEIFRNLVSLIRDGRLDYAKPRLEKFIERFSSSEWADDSRFLLGAISEEAGDHVAALQHYLALERQYPASDTYPLSLLRIALCYDRMGKYQMALEYYRKTKSHKSLAGWHELCEDREKRLDGFRN